MGNVASVPWPLWKHGGSTSLGSRGAPSLFSACRAWSFKAGRIMGEGCVGSTRASWCPLGHQPPRLLNPLSSHKKTNRMEPHYLRAWMMCPGGRCLYVVSTRSTPRVLKGRFTAVPSCASSPWKTEKGQKNRKEGRACPTFPGREGRGMGALGAPGPGRIWWRTREEESLPCGALGLLRGVYPASVPLPTPWTISQDAVPSRPPHCTPCAPASVERARDSP